MHIIQKEPNVPNSDKLNFLFCCSILKLNMFVINYHFLKI